VLLSSHILSEVEALCDRVAIVRAGRAAESGTFDQLRHLTRTSVVVETSRPVDGLTGLTGVHDVSVDGPRTRFSVDHGELNRVLERLVELDVRTLVSSPPTLEELFLGRRGHHAADRQHARGEWAGRRRTRIRLPDRRCREHGG